MKPSTDPIERRDQLIAALLWYGTWFASFLIAAGLFVTAVEPFQTLPFHGHDVVKAGVAVFILLPVARVALMLAIFLRERDGAYVAIAALVLGILAAGVFLEL